MIDELDAKPSRNSPTVLGEPAQRRVLFVSYTFPPVGGAGVQRVTKFVKFLPQHGWIAAVLTAANPSVPMHDPTLSRDIPENTIICRAKTWEPAYKWKAAVTAVDAKPNLGSRIRGLAAKSAKFAANLFLQPDPQILWLPHALKAGKALLRKHRFDAVVASGPPFSSFLLGTLLADHAKIPCVLDYRDEWSISNAHWENRQRNRVALSIQARLERYALRSARAVVATTGCSARAIDRLRQLANSRATVDCIYNGFDPDDFSAGEIKTPARERHRIVYIGTLWKLTSILPLVAAVERLASQRPEIARQLEILVMGRSTAEQDQLLSRLNGTPCRLVREPYAAHTAAIQAMRAADTQCVLLSDEAGAERVLPAKVFEYLAADRPILAIAPQGELWDLLRASNTPFRCFHPAAVDEIAAYLVERVTASSRGESTGQVVPEFANRRFQAGQLARLLDSLVV